MPLFSILTIICLAGAVGGLVNALLSENGFILPKQVPVNGSNGTAIWRPGYLGNILIGAVAAVVSWGLYGPFSSAYLFGSSLTPNTEPKQFGLTLSAFVGAVLVGIGGAKWLSDEVDKRLLKAAASQAAKKEGSSDASRDISLSSPAGALNIAKNM